MTTGTFISNGLLDDSSKPPDDDSFKLPDSSFLSESQDDTQLPSFSQLVKPYAPKDASTLPSAPRIQSWSLRATTYDGRTLHLKRKRRVKVSCRRPIPPVCANA